LSGDFTPAKVSGSLVRQSLGMADVRSDPLWPVVVECVALMIDSMEFAKRPEGQADPFFMVLKAVGATPEEVIRTTKEHVMGQWGSRYPVASVFKDRLLLGRRDAGMDEVLRQAERQSRAEDGKRLHDFLERHRGMSFREVRCAVRKRLGLEDLPESPILATWEAAYNAEQACSEPSGVCSEDSDGIEWV
jgi:hypothetical protein